MTATSRWSAQFCNRDLQRANPFVYGPPSDVAKLTILETSFVLTDDPRANVIGCTMKKLLKLLPVLLMVCLVIGMLAWWVLLGTICSMPLAPVGQYTVPYNCHGTTVFISSLQNALLNWLIPACVVVGLCWKVAKKHFDL
jgi:hypothetical protein